MLPMLDNMRNKETLHQALFVVSLFYNRLSQYQLSKKYVSRLLNDNPSARNSCVASMLNVEASYRLNELTQQELDESFVELCRRENEFIASGIIYSFAARWYLRNGDKKRSLEVLLDNLTATESTKYYLLIATYYSLIAETYYELDNFPLAQKYALLVLNKTTKEHKSEAIVRATKVLYLINKNSGDYEKALEHHELYQRQHLLINDDRNKRSISYQIAQKENREKSHEISLLAEKNKRLNVEKALFEQSAKSQQLQILLLSSVIIWLVYWAFRSYRVQSKLRNIADHDELTGIFNRRCFHELADSALKYCNKTNQPVSLLMFDLDHFKGINDQYGHHVGDWALKSTVDACKVLCRKNDIIGRFGGEEFTILLPGCANEKARELAEIYRHAIESISTEELGLDFNISASFGVFSSQKPSDTLTDVIKAADCAMYYSKQQGRNRVSVYGIDINSKSVGIN